MNIKIFQEDNYSNSIFCYIPNVLSLKEQKNLLNYINNNNNFKYNPSYTNSKNGRLQKWFQEDKKYFCPKWKKHYNWWCSFEYDKTIKYLQNIIQTFINTNKIINKYNIKKPKINSCLLNKYRNGNDYISPHRDTILSFGEEPTIIGLSLGQTRQINFKRVIINNYSKSLSNLDKNKQDLNFSFELESGSIFIMAGSSQRFFSHSIPKSNTHNIRYSFTFREFIL